MIVKVTLTGWQRPVVHRNCSIRISTNGVLQVYRGCYQHGTIAVYAKDEWRRAEEI